MTRLYGWVLLVLVLAFAGVSFIAYQHNRARGSEAAVSAQLAEYTNGTYGYSISYSPAYTVRVFSDSTVTVGEAGAGEFTTITRILVATTTEATSYPAFARQEVLRLCEEGGDTCKVTEEPFKTQTNLSGTRFSLSRTTAEGATESYGPVYAFMVSANVPEARYATLLIASQATREDLTVEGLANTLRIMKVEHRAP